MDVILGAWCWSMIAVGVDVLGTVTAAVLCALVFSVSTLARSALVGVVSGCRRAGPCGVRDRWAWLEACLPLLVFLPSGGKWQRSRPRDSPVCDSRGQRAEPACLLQGAVLSFGGYGLTQSAVLLAVLYMYGSRFPRPWQAKKLRFRRPSPSPAHRPPSRTR